MKRAIFVFLSLAAMFLTACGAQSAIAAPIGAQRPIAAPDGSIPFAVGVSVNIHASDSPAAAKIAREYSELVSIYSSDDNPNEVDYIANYGEGFFTEKALIVLFITATSGSYSFNVSYVTVNGQTLTAEIARNAPGNAVTCDMAYWRILLEVNKSDIAGVENCQMTIIKG